MKVLMLSKACIVGTYQKKLEEMAAIDEIELTVVVPPSWDDPRGPTRLERVHTAGYDMIVTSIAFNGNYHLHFYPKLRRIVRDLRPDIFHIDEEPYNLATFQATRLAQSVGVPAVAFTWQNLLRRYPPPFNLMERYVLNRLEALLARLDLPTRPPDLGREALLAPLVHDKKRAGGENIWALPVRSGQVVCRAVAGTDVAVNVAVSPTVN